jgi:transmembrane sensor
MEPYTGWLTGRLVFENAPLQQVLTELERWYAFEFRVADQELAARRVTARLRAASLDDMLRALTLALAAQYTRAGDTITILKPGRSP